MTISDAQYSAWLDADGRQREILVEVGCNHSSSEITRYLSRYGYTTVAADTPANTHYDARLTGQLQLARKVSVTAADPSVSINLSTIDFNNIDGVLDDWLNDAWEKRSVKVFLGDPSWPRADFRQIFAGRGAALQPAGRGGLNLSIYDEMQRLNSILSETTVGGVSTNKDAVIPQTFGEVFNISPLLTDPAVNEYQWHPGDAQSAIEVRDNGAPVSFIATPSTGKFILSAAPFGTITMDAQGAKTSGGVYVHGVADIIQEIVTAYGDPVTRLSSGEIDSTNFATFAAANTQHIGLYLTGKVNVLQACNQVARSVQASLHFSRAGLLRLWRPPTGAASPVMSFTTADMEDGSFQPVEILPAAPAVSLAWGQNYTPMTQLAGGLPASSISEFNLEWRTTTANDPTSLALHRYTSQPTPQNTQLIVESEVNAEAATRVSFGMVSHPIVEFKTTLKAVELELGQAITITHPRFGCGAGRDGWVIGITEDHGNSSSPFRVLLEVMF